MTCPFLEYRTAANGQEFEVARAYCGAVEEFVQPMRADICNDRYDLDHATDCEIYLEHADELDAGGANADDSNSDGTNSEDDPS